MMFEDVYRRHRMVGWLVGYTKVLYCHCFRHVPVKLDTHDQHQVEMSLRHISCASVHSL